MGSGSAGGARSEESVVVGCEYVDEDEHGCGSGLLLSLPDDVLSLISTHLNPSDLTSLSLCCRRLRSAVASSEKVWLSQCLKIIPSHSLLSSWRLSLPSYRSLCRFISSVSPLLGVWVHQNPELGNVVSVVWGSSISVSIVGCRIIPQELSPDGLDSGPILWAPVFEILPSPDGHQDPLFFLHGHHDTVYPGSFLPVLHPNPNVLLLEVHSNSTSSSPPPPQFSRLSFGDRRRLLDLISTRVCNRIPIHLEAAPLFPASPQDEVLLAERRLNLLQMHKLSGGGMIDWRSDSEILGSIDHHHLHHYRRRTNSSSNIGGCEGDTRNSSSAANCRKRSLFSVVKQIIGGRSNSNSNPNPNLNSTSAVSSSSLPRNGSSGGGQGRTSESRHMALNEFLGDGDTIGLALQATNMRLTTYRGWPNMHENRFALYKLPLQDPSPGKDYAGVWAGTFGWPPGKPSIDKPGKALFFLLLSYEEEVAAEGRHLLLIATKILEGTHYVLHPNGSAMFTVKLHEQASSEPDTFPWETDGDGVPVQVKHTYTGEGISNGYGFRYPGSKPGFLYEIQDGRLAFVWKESKAVLALQRLDLETLLKKGERVPALPPILNFSYLTKSYSNVFAGFPTKSSFSPSSPT